MSRSGRAPRLIPALLLATVLSACGGGGGSSSGGVSALPAVPTSTNQSVTVQGAIVAIGSPSVFSLQSVDGRQLSVLTNPSTVIGGPAPFVGEAVEVTGTSASSTQIAASAVRQSASGSVSAQAGTIVLGGSYAASTSGGFTLTSANGNEAVTTTNSTTYANGKPKAGDYVEASGPGTAGVSVTAQLAAIFPSAPGQVTLTGIVKQQTTYGFTLTLTSGAPLPVAVVSATALSGPVAVGQQVSVTGIGSATVAIFASSIAPVVSVAPSPSPTASAVPVTSSTATPAPVSSPVATASPTIAPSPAPTLAPTPVPTIAPTPVPTVAPTPGVPAPSYVPPHVQTAEYLWSSTEESTSPSVYAPYLTYAYTKTSLLGPTHAAGIKTVLYTNPMMPHSSGSYDMNEITSSYAGVQAKDCSGNSVRTYSNTGYLADMTNFAAGSYMSAVVNDYANNALSANPGYANPFDLVFMDNANSFYGVSAMPCNYSSSTWTADMDSAIQAEPYQTLINTLSVTTSSIPGKVAGLQASNIVGGEYEACYNDRQWTAEEEAQIQTISALKSQGKSPGAGFWCYLDGTSSDGSTATGLRMFAYASFLLTYDPNYSVFQESFASSPSTFKVMPETQFVPMEPQKTASAISDLQTSSGAYVQQYAYCYYKRNLVGSCEIVVNPGTATVSVPNLGNYAHSVVLTGSGVLDGGQVTFDGGAPASLAPGTAAILTP